MKNVFSLITKYCFLLVVGNIAGIVGYCLFMLCTSLVAGTVEEFPKLQTIVSAIPVVFAFAAAAACLLLVCILAAQSGAYFLPAIVSIGFSLLTWFVIIPTCDSFRLRLETQNSVSIARKPTSPGYFRPEAAGLQYFSSVNAEKNTASGMFIDFTTASITASTTGGQTRLLKDVPINSDTKTLYSDVLIQNTMRVPAPCIAIIRLLRGLYDTAVRARGTSFLAWFCFASICFPLSALVSLARTWQWRILNLCAIFVAATGILVLNVSYHVSEFFLPLKSLIPATTAFASAQPFLAIAALNSLLATVILIGGLAANAMRPVTERFT